MSKKKPAQPTVTLRFKCEDDKRNFMADLCDGRGEGMCSLKWPWEQGVKFHECDTFDVELFEGDFDD